MGAVEPGAGAASPRRGRLLVRCGEVLLVFALLLYVGDILYSSRYGQSALSLPISWMGLWTLALLCAWGAIRIVHWGRRLQVLPAAELLARDRRGPVLYLRSFRDDPAAHTVFDRLYTRLHYRTEEEELAATFEDVGPLVAVGHPGEALPELGAARFYFSDAEWKDRVGELMASAQLVLLRTGGSRGLAWELARAVRTLTPEKLLLLVGDAESFEAFCRAVEPGLAARLASLKIAGGLGSMRGFIAFGPDFTPRYLPLRRSWLRWTFTHPYLDELRVALQPIFAARGFPHRRPPFPILRTVIVGLLAALSLYLSFHR